MSRSRRGLGLGLALGLPAAALTWRWLANPPRPGHPYLAGAPLLVAHRGGAALAPENTMLAFRRALAWWRADMLELDVHSTLDGEVVVIHDPTLERTTDGTGRVAEHALAELRELDAGYRFTPDGGSSFPFRGRGVGIPTLREVLTELPPVRVNVEIKDARAQHGVRSLIEELGVHHRVLVAAGERANRGLFDDYAGPTSAAREELTAFVALHRLRAAGLYTPPVDALQVPEEHGGTRIVTPRFVRDAHARNLAVHVWTVDDEAAMHRLLEWGVDGIMSDRPDRLARVLHQRAGRPRAPGPPSPPEEPFLEWLLRS